MLARRIIPTLLCRGRTLIKGKQFDGWRSCGLALQAARIHAMRGVDELVLLDIGATPEGRGPDLKLVEQLAADMHTPLAVGGGVRTVDDVRNLLRAGADKVVIGQASIDNPEFIRIAADKFGSQAIVVSIDVVSGPGGFIRLCDRGMVPMLWAQSVEALGAGEILLTAADREGMLNGYDIDLIGTVSAVVNIPVIAHGGCGRPQDMLEAIQNGADAVAAGAMFQFTDATPAGAARFLHEAGIEVRMPSEEAA